jgi:hypothetical protein
VIFVLKFIILYIFDGHLAISVLNLSSSNNIYKRFVFAWIAYFNSENKDVKIKEVGSCEKDD